MKTKQLLTITMLALCGVNVKAQCNITIPAGAIPITASSSGSSNTQPYWICSGISFTYTGSSNNVLYLENGANARLVNPSNMVIYMKSGSNLNGGLTLDASDVIYFVTGPSITNPGGVPTQIYCPVLTFSYTTAPPAGCTVTAVPELSGNSNNLSVYPNPAHGIFELVVTNDTFIKEKPEIKIYNVLGEIIYQTEMVNEKSEIDLAEQPAGIYFIKVGSLTKKIIKE